MIVIEYVVYTAITITAMYTPFLIQKITTGRVDDC